MATGGLTFPGEPQPPVRYRRLAWVAVGGVLLCVVSILILTLLLPGEGTYAPNGGFVPVAPSARVP